MYAESFTGLDVYRHVIDVFKDVQWKKMQLGQKQSCYNQLSEYDSAYVLIRETIEMNPSMGYPYSTLAETFAFQDELDSCFFYLEKSLALGMSTEVIQNDSLPRPHLTINFQK